MTILNMKWSIFFDYHMINELTALGFSEKEAHLYATIVELGETTIGPLEKKLQTHKQILYNLIDKLNKRGVVLTTHKNGRKYFSIADPDILRSQIEAQKAIVESLVPKIYANSGAVKQLSEIRTYDGLTAVHAFHLKMFKQCPKEAIVEILGAGGDAFLKIAQQCSFFDRYENIRVQEKISHKLLMYENQRNDDRAYVERKYVEAKYLPEHFIQPIATQIWPDRIAILFFDQAPKIIEIKSAKITEGFRNYFSLLWKIASK